MKHRETLRIPYPSWQIQFDPSRVDFDGELSWAGHVLVRGGPGPIAERREFVLIFEGPRWRTHS